MVDRNNRNSYVVPVNVLEHFLEDVRRHDGNYLGFPKIGINYRILESPALRQSLRMLPKHTGVLVVTTQVTFGRYVIVCVTYDG